MQHISSAARAINKKQGKRWKYNDRWGGTHAHERGIERLGVHLREQDFQQIVHRIIVAIDGAPDPLARLVRLGFGREVWDVETDHGAIRVCYEPENAYVISILPIEPPTAEQADDEPREKLTKTQKERARKKRQKIRNGGIITETEAQKRKRKA